MKNGTQKNVYEFKQYVFLIAVQLLDKQVLLITAQKQMRVWRIMSGYLTCKDFVISTLLAGEDFNDAVPIETESIIFTDKIAPSGIAVTDLSVEKNNGIVGWLDGTTYYVSTQVSGKKIKANSDCHTLLSNWNYNEGDEEYHNYKSFDVKNLDVRNVTNMAEMFEGTEVTSLDLSSWETKKVIDMNSMFSGCGSLTTLDVKQIRYEQCNRYELHVLQLQESYYNICRR